MPKKKRTRKDKIQADVRRKTPSTVSQTSTHVESSSPSEQQTPITGTFSLPQDYAKITKPSPKRAAPAAEINTSAYGYLRGDLLKTTILTILIVGAELAIYFFMMK